MVGVFFGIGSVEAGFGGEFGEIDAVGGVAGRVGCRGGGAGGGVGGALGRGLIVGVTAGIAITSGLSAWLSWVLAAETRNGERQPGTLGQGMDLSSRGCRGRPGWDRSEIPFSGPHAGPVHDRAAPVDEALAAEFVQECVVQVPPQTGFGPLAEAAVRGLERHPERRWQIPPCASAGQHVHDRNELWLSG